MATETEVAQLAATLIGTDVRITSLDDDKTLARTLKAVWNLQRRATIRGGSWNFATRRASLPSEAGVPTSELEPYSYRFPLPDGALKLIEGTDFRLYEDFQTEAGSVYVRRAGPLPVRYLIDVENPAKWSDDFADAFAKRLAATCGRKIAGTAYDAAEGWQIYHQAMVAAKGSDAKENPPIGQEESSWVAARGAMGSAGIYPDTGVWYPE